MKRVLRDVVYGAFGCVATIGAGSGMLLAAASDALAQDTTAPPAPAPQTAAPARPSSAPAQQGATHGAPAESQPGAAHIQQPGIPIRRIVVEGNQRIEPATITSYLLVHPGDTFDPERVDLSLKTLFATGLFADVQIEQRDADLVVSVIENPIINRVIFEGLHTLNEDNLEDEVQARPRSVFTPARAQADVQRIIEVYRRSGHFAAQVTPQVRELDQNRVDLIFEVDEGPVTGVRDINFIGNDAFSDTTCATRSSPRNRLVEFLRQQRQLRSRSDRVRPRTAAPILQQPRLRRLPRRLRRRRTDAGPEGLLHHLHGR